jgi:hypothetical protein
MKKSAELRSLGAKCSRSIFGLGSESGYLSVDAGGQRCGLVLPVGIAAGLFAQSKAKRGCDGMSSIVLISNQQNSAEAMTHRTLGMSS